MHPHVRRQLAFPAGVPDVPGLELLVASVGDAYTAADRRFAGQAQQLAQRLGNAQRGATASRLTRVVIV